MRIVVKIGTNLLTTKDGAVNAQRIRGFAHDLAEAKKAGHQVVLVTSGAIGAGMGKLGMKQRPSTLREKQALAAVGQPLLMEIYQEAFDDLDVIIAQVLLTRQDFDDRKRYLNARNTMLTLLAMGVLPVINENDTVAVEEINIGDNDTLAALVAAKINADLVVLLTDVEGLYKGIPGKSELVTLVEKITPEIEQYATDRSSSGKGVGGMQTKIRAAKIAVAAGVRMVITTGQQQGTIGRIVGGESMGTTFLPSDTLDARKCWIAFGAKCRGKVFVDEGAANALLKMGRSLLPSGIIAVEGSFEAGDPVSVFDQGRKEIGRGLAYYSSEEIARIKGKKTGEVKKILSRSDVDEVIHRDNLVIL